MTTHDLHVYGGSGRENDDEAGCAQTLIRRTVYGVGTEK